MTTKENLKGVNDTRLSSLFDNSKRQILFTSLGVTIHVENHLQSILKFLHEIGLKVELRELTEETFLPGMTVIDGALIVDPERVKWPGDLLHEAGHLALLSKTERQNWSGDFTGAGGYEMGAIAWSYAAAIKLGIPVDVLFHQDGYKGDADWLIEIFSNGPGIGIPVLEWLRMATSDGPGGYPEMVAWLCPLE